MRNRALPVGDNANSFYEREILILSIVADRMRSSTHWPRLRYRQVSREGNEG